MPQRYGGAYGDIKWTWTFICAYQRFLEHLAAAHVNTVGCLGG